MPRTHLAFAAAVALAAIAHAEDLPDDQMAPYQFSAVINADNVYVRSYASENDYPITRLSNGDTVTVVGNRGDWLKILPPTDTFCLVGKAWVDARSNGTVGRVRDDANNIPVRLGSNLVPQYGKIVTQVTAGQDVKILGQVENAYYKILPPPGTFAYVHMRFVDLIKRVEVVNDHGTLAVKPTGDPALKNIPRNDDPSPKGQLVKVPPDANGPTTKPAAVTMTSTTPTTRPSTEATAAFDALEVRFAAASKQSLADQPLAALIGDYQKTLDARQVPESMLKVAEYRLAGLKLRQEAAASLRQTEQDRTKQAAATAALTAEGHEISEKMAANEFKRYTAVGTMRTSSLPNAGRPLYRLTDPVTGRTVVYLADAGNAAAMEGQFVGVRGVVADDSSRQIKLLTAKSVEPVDPAEVSRGEVTSTMTPPSLSATSDASR